VNLLVLLTDAFGGRGGIAKFNRDLLNALCTYPEVDSVTALPRRITADIGVLPARLVYETQAATGKTAYMYQLGRLLSQRNAFAAVVCAHIHLLPLAALAARRYGVPLILIVHGIEVWQRPRISGLDRCFRSVDMFVSVSEFTKKRFLEWAPLRPDQGHVIPDCVDLTQYGPGPKPERLLQRYGVSNRKIMMTLGRLDSTERYKGIDEVLEIMPSLVKEIPDLTYIIAGEGNDRPRLELKVKSLGLSERAVFTGYVPEAEKADHYHLADAFVMPGHGEGFGIVYLEAMACGIPVVASKVDASREAVLDGRLGVLADPSNPDEIIAAIKEALTRSRGVPNGLEYFSFRRFVERWHVHLREKLPNPKYSSRLVREASAPNAQTEW
jgi:phosphatidylinositol alpha-1,6-mannosyltransferase